MDVPDAFLALSKLLNYMQLQSAVLSFAIFILVWSYFRHYLNLRIIASAWSEFHLMPDVSKQWKTSDGVWMVWWMQYQVIAPIILLQLVNLFWYFLIWRILIRVLFSSELEDERSEDGGDDDDRNSLNDTTINTVNERS